MINEPHSILELFMERYIDEFIEDTININRDINEMGGIWLGHSTSNFSNPGGPPNPNDNSLLGPVGLNNSNDNSDNHNQNHNRSLFKLVAYEPIFDKFIYPENLHHSSVPMPSNDAPVRQYFEGGLYFAYDHSDPDPTKHHCRVSQLNDDPNSEEPLKEIARFRSPLNLVYFLWEHKDINKKR
jgi:hypothetical protein